MARKPNFRFERQERERVHAEKRAARDALKEQRKAELEGGVDPAGESAAADAAAPVGAVPGAPPVAPGAVGAPAEPPTAAAIAAMKRLGTMTPEQVAILHQNAVRLANSGSPKQRAAAQELLPQLEAELHRLGEAKRQAVAARLAGAAKRSKKQ